MHDANDTGQCMSPDGAGSALSSRGRHGSVPSDEDGAGTVPSRRGFLGAALRGVAVAAVGAVTGLAAHRARTRETVWQLDPEKCTQCGRCATSCVMTPSAVKCVHAYDVCGYCDLCGGYLRPDAMARDTGAENQLCPTGAIKRTYVEDPYYEYTIDEELCIGCGKCVKGCGAFGNGSLFLQVRHDRCLNCNECRIAAHCPSEAFRRVPVDAPYLMRGAAGHHVPGASATTE